LIGCCQKHPICDTITAWLKKGFSVIIPFDAAQGERPLYEITIGVEVHVQLNTKSKIFCNCSTSFAQEPNSNICPVCAGHPGVLPTLNKQVVNSAIMVGIATNCTINKHNEFARKHYFYPDLPKNYQITQSTLPICEQGYITITKEDGTPKNIRIMRIHMEEDAGKNIHSGSESFIDLNRAGTPLLEIVTEPDINSIHELRAYLKALHGIVTYLGICSGNMEEGAFRADTNISIRKPGQPLGTRVELKNINSFKFIADATEYEIARQAAVLDSGEKIRQETRLWDTKEHKTIAMRGKESAADYRYLPDPDLPVLAIDDAWIASVKENLPELPAQKQARLCKEYNLSEYEADILINDPEVAHYYEAAAKLVTSKLLINWVLRDVMGFAKEHKIALAHCKITPELLAELVTLLESNKINTRTAQELFGEVAKTGASPKALVAERGLEQIEDTAALEAIIKEIIDANPTQAAEYKAGKDKLFGFFVGKAMQKTGGKGNTQIINELLKKYLQ